MMRLGEQDHAGPTSQRADRLSEAIDIRTWVTVKYLITRPGATRRERWGARGVTVSKGESRLIVLAPCSPPSLPNTATCRRTRHACAPWTKYPETSTTRAETASPPTSPASIWT